MRFAECHPDRKHKALGLCRSCYNQTTEQRAKISGRYEQWASDNPTYHADKHLRKKYGITLEDYERKLLDQGGGCAICGSKVPGGRGRFHVDHQHGDGYIRGLLCQPCNAALGLFRDNPAIVREASNYLMRHWLGFLRGEPWPVSEDASSPSHDTMNHGRAVE